MNDDPRLDDSRPEGENGTPESQTPQRISLFARVMEALAHLGLGEMAVRIGTNALAFLLVLLLRYPLNTALTVSASASRSSCR